MPRIRFRSGAIAVGLAFVGLALLVILWRCSPPSAQPPAPGGGSPAATRVTAVKIIVDEDGIYQVEGTDLARAGFDLASATADQLELSVGGQPEAFELVGQGRGAAVRFYGRRLSADSYTPRNVYWLRRISGSASATPESVPRPQPTATPISTTGGITATVHLEQDLHYDGQAEQFGDRWYWEALFAPAEVEIPLDAPGVTSGQGELRVSLISKSEAQVDPDHRLLIFLNDALVSDAPWDGARPHLVTAVIPDGLLKPDANHLVIRAPGDTGAAADAVHLQWIEVSYPRTPAPDGEDPVLAPRAVTSAAESTLPDWPDGADMVIITVPQFHAALQPLVEARTKQGLRVAVLDVEQVYDAFSYGRTDPRAIQALVRYAARVWPAPSPRFLLLAGDASYDPLGRTGGTEADLVPTQNVYTTYSGWTGSDVWFALPDDGPAARPALAVGRFPSQTAEQLEVMVKKTLDYEHQSGDLAWRAKAVLIADNDEPGFAEEAAAFAAASGYTAQQLTIEGDGSQARAALAAGFRAGTGLIGYFGHGSITLWAKEKVFDVADAAKLDNADRLPVVFTVTCLSGFFEHPATVSLGEVLLRQPGGGAVAALVPSSAAVLADQRLLSQGLAAALAKPGQRSLGDVIRDAQTGLPAQVAGVREILLTFNLLGDPSLRLNR